ncbi:MULTISPECIES: hypothetical protein [Agrobacterium]|uniref:hypothetical protein n=1 Tax=Agrobacterium tumefaciens TaxID=358 RepID=UPI00157345C2|nr:hypothetical protein [Agrobacterium tumefaciens]
MYTVVIDESERQRMMVNEINKAVRRCKIGKVTRKTHPVPAQIKDMFRGAFWPQTGTIFPTQTYMPKCGCKVGSACGNVACPHRLTATCSIAA